MSGLQGQELLLGKLGKHSTGKGCLCIKRLADVDENQLQQLINNSVKRLPKS